MRVFSLCVALLLLVTIVPVSAAQAADIDGHWGAASILYLYEQNVMTGDGKGNFRPNDRITRAEYAAIINRAFGFTLKTGAVSFSDVDYTQWYGDEIMCASAQGYLQGSGGKASPLSPISRQEAFAILRRVIKLDTYAGSTGFADHYLIADWAQPEIGAMWQAGYVSGSNNKVNPTGYLTRAEAAQVICNVLGERFHASGTYYSANNKKNVTITTSGVTLSNCTVSGDLTITEGVGNGHVTLNNVVILGRLVIAGGGANSIYLNGSTVTQLRVQRPQNYQATSQVPRIVADAYSVIRNAHVFSHASFEGDVDAMLIRQTCSVGLKGDYGTVELQAGANVSLGTDSTIRTLTVNAGSYTPSIDLADESVVTTLNTNSPASITGKGEIAGGHIRADGVKISSSVSVALDKLTVAKNIDITIGNTTYTGTGDTLAEAGSDRLSQLKEWADEEQAGEISSSHPAGLNKNWEISLLTKDRDNRGEPAFALDACTITEPSEDEFTIKINMSDVGQVLYVTKSNSTTRDDSGNYLGLHIPFPDGYELKSVTEDGSKTTSLGSTATATPFTLYMPVKSSASNKKLTLEWVKTSGSSDTFSEIYTITFTGTAKLESSSDATVRTQLEKLTVTNSTITAITHPTSSNDGTISVNVPTNAGSSITLSPTAEQSAFTDINYYSNAACTKTTSNKVTGLGSNTAISDIYIKVTHHVSLEEAVYRVSFTRGAGITAAQAAANVSIGELNIVNANGVSLNPSNANESGFTYSYAITTNPKTPTETGGVTSTLTNPNLSLSGTTLKAGSWTASVFGRYSMVITVTATNNSLSPKSATSTKTVIVYVNKSQYAVTTPTASEALAAAGNVTINAINTSIDAGGSTGFTLSKASDANFTYTYTITNASNFSISGDKKSVTHTGAAPNQDTAYPITYTVTATAIANTSITGTSPSKTVNVTVKAPILAGPTQDAANTAAGYVIVYATSDTITEGETATILIDKTSDGDYTYEFSVKSGIGYTFSGNTVTGTIAGSITVNVTVTATSKAANQQKGTASKTVTITVNAATPPGGGEQGP